MQQPYQSEVAIPVAKQIIVSGSLTIPEETKGLVIFSQNSDSNRLSALNKMVADYLVQQGFSTLLFDLLASERFAYENHNAVRSFAERLVIVSEWLLSFEKTINLHQAYFGTNKDAAAAIYAAAAEGTEIAAVVLCGGRPDLAMEVLPALQTPTLLIVGSVDSEVLHSNQKAFETMHCPKRLEVITGASLFFEEKGTMEKVCVQASSWFEQYLHPIRMIPR
jgi:putative phosphoribosyl transferase